MSGVIMTIHLFHLSDLEETTRRALEKRLNPLEMPKNCFFVDTEPIPDATLTLLFVQYSKNSKSNGRGVEEMCSCWSISVCLMVEHHSVILNDEL
jgi:hypothetical protein